MPRARVHRRVGAVAGGAATFFVGHKLPGEARLVLILAGGLGGYVGGLAPDILEPGLHGWHRSFFHSAIAGAGVTKAGIVAGMALITDMLTQAGEFRSRRLGLEPEHPDRTVLGLKEFGLYLASGALLGFAVGYLSHLALDMGTKRGVPLVARSIV